MKITDDEYKTAQDLTKMFLAQKHRLPYANVDTNNAYSGWVTDFRLRDGYDQKIHLNLNSDDDLFLLFVLAVVWSRTGPWENSAFFVAYLKLHNKHTSTFWIDQENSTLEKNANTMAAKTIVNMVNGIKARKKVSFRKDVYDSVHVLARNWDTILNQLMYSEKEGDFGLFMNHIRKIEGLGVGNKKMRIKIPLILRELRCQNIYTGIPGEYCCVPDKRVYDAAEALHISLPALSTFENLKVSSAKIYKLFGNLYDLPLFAYPDLAHMVK